MELIQIVINQCEICQEVKYGKKTIKPKFNITETPTEKNEIVYIDTHVMKRYHFLTIIDKFSKFGAACPLTNRNYIILIEQLEDRSSLATVMSDTRITEIRIVDWYYTKNNSNLVVSFLFFFSKNKNKKTFKKIRLTIIL